MKNVRLLVLPLLFLALTSLVLPRPQVQPVPRLTTLYYTWTGDHYSPAIDFVCSTSSGTGSNELGDGRNWNNGTTTAPPCFTPIDLLCTVQVELLGGSMPNRQDIINAVMNEYNRLASLSPAETFTDGYSWTISLPTSNPVGTVKITVYLKS